MNISFVAVNTSLSVSSFPFANTIRSVFSQASKPAQDLMNAKFVRVYGQIEELEVKEGI